jgi:hypothetical protein
MQTNVSAFFKSIFQLSKMIYKQMNIANLNLPELTYSFYAKTREKVLKH